MRPLLACIGPKPHFPNPATLAPSRPRAIRSAPPRPRRSYPPHHVYRVVSSVEHYHHFVPWCVSSTVLRRDVDARYLEAELAVGFQLFVERYISRVTMEEGRSVRVRGGVGRRGWAALHLARHDGGGEQCARAWRGGVVDGWRVGGRARSAGGKGCAGATRA